MTAAEPPRPRHGQRRWWFISGGVVLIVAAILTTVVVMRTTAMTGSRVFTHFPADCALIGQATADTYAPGTTCTAKREILSEAYLLNARGADLREDLAAAPDRWDR